MRSWKKSNRPHRRIGISELEARLRKNRTTIWRWYKAGKFPAPHYISNDREWWEDEVERWELEQMEAYAHGDAA